ncbi:hypothetical protein FH972_022141 [Carpinus fangiana]|uniref:Uncharacterized protein n=1 Tax=Carpinus fangiana TaxID=176857 RepID=A0A5N6KRR1_9ROSI|nr:hypothetical protein FH972_022141 [Carpinus fangiana]
MRPRTTSQQHKVVISHEQDTVDIVIHVPFLKAEGLGLITWASSSVLANQLHRLDIHPAALKHNDGIKVLELGAGTGLVGISAAVIWHTNVVLTDLAPIVPGLTGNVDSNKDLLKSSQGSAMVGTLDWNAPESLFLRDHPEGLYKEITLSNATDKASVILAADTIYWEEHPRMLLTVILAWLGPGEHSRVVFTYPLRVAYIDHIRELWELLQSNGLESIDEGRIQIDGDEWEDEPLIEWCVWKWK